MNDALAKLTAATTMLAQAKTLDEVKPIIDLASAAATYARAAKLGQEAVNHAAETKLRAERKAGELLTELAEQTEKGGDRRSNKFNDNRRLSLNANTPYSTVLTENDIEPMTAHRWQSVAKIPEPVFNQYIDVIKTRNDELTRSGLLRAASLPLAAANHAVSFDPDYDGDEWYTPRELIALAKQVMGDIDLDPASCPEAQRSVVAGNYYDKEKDGLSQPWYGRVWLNPPYSAALIQRFIDKAIQEWQSDNITAALVLVNNSTETRWFQSMLGRFPACFISSRVRFWRENNETFGARQGQCVFYLGNDPRSFVSAFQEVGIVVRRV